MCFFFLLCSFSSFVCSIGWFYCLFLFCLWCWLGLLLHFILCHCISACVSFVYSLKRSLHFWFVFYKKPVAVYITNQCEKLEEEKKSISYRNLLWMIKGKYKCWGFVWSVHSLYYTFLFFAQPSHWRCSPFPA